MQFRRKPLVTLGFLVFALVAAYEVSQFIITGNMVGLAFIAMAFVGGTIVIGILNNWRNGLYFFIAWLLYEDLIRKYMGNNMAIYFVKDFLGIVVYLAFFLAYRRKKLKTFRPPFFMPLMIFVWFGFMQVFNPASPTFFYGILGMKLYFFYIPLLFIGYALIDTELDLRRFFFVNMGLSVMIVALGIVQSILGSTFLNPEHPAEDLKELSTLYRIAPISGVVVYRPTSVFVSDGRFGHFLTVSWLLFFGFTGYLLLRRGKGRNFAFICVGMIAAASALCASRGVVVWNLFAAIAGSAAFLWGAPWRQGQVIRVLRGLQRAALGAALGLSILFATFPTALLDRLAFYSETLDPRSSTNELANRGWDYPVKNLLAAFNYERWPYGYGIGTISLGGQYVTRILHVPPPTTSVESGYGSIIIEMGIGGIILWLVMSFSIVISGWNVARKLKGTPWFPVAFVIVWYAFLLLFPLTYGGLQPYQDFVLNAYLWLLLGILFRLPTVALSPQFSLGASSPQPSTKRWMI
jgi:hypothetical protein